MAATNQTLVFITDPKVLAVPIQDNGEPLVDLREEGGICLGPSPEIPNNQDYYHLRKSVYERLIAAQKLLPAGLKFCLYEGYRSLELQKVLFDTRLAKMKRLHPDWTHDQQFIETTRLVSPVVNLDGSHNVPTHSTGGTFDIYLINEEGEAVDMGIHPKDWAEDDDGSLSLPDSKLISKEAKVNRGIMSKALTAVGFTNLMTEYWHWSYGDRYWACREKKSCAIYGAAPRAGTH